MQDKTPLWCPLLISPSSEAAPWIHPPLAACDPYCSHHTHRKELLSCAQEVQACRKSFRELVHVRSSTVLKGCITGRANHCTDAGRHQANNKLWWPVFHPQQLSGRIASRKTPRPVTYFSAKYAKQEAKIKGAHTGRGEGIFV